MGRQGEKTEQEKWLDQDYLPTKGTRGQPPDLHSQANLDPGVLTTFQAGMMDPRPPHLPSCKLKGCNSSQGFW